MTPERWQRIDQVLQAVLARPEPERATAVLELTGDDETLRADVTSMLSHLARASVAGFGTRPVAVKMPRASLLDRRLGPYIVQGWLGSGGMGDVYRAHDATLGRDVALKTLPEPWLIDPERRLRFEREARLLASLNHPNIGAIFGVHESEGVRALVLELVDGETLAERIARHAGGDAERRGLPLADVMTMAGQLLAALEAAHERGIVHRDLKPANIKITPGARVKVLDFGLARALIDGEGDSAGSEPDISDTRPGMLLGTAAYMSPEQARGRAVDRRTDVWAFGCVLFEMLTGVQAFGGADVAETLANVIRAEPDWRALPRDTPRALRMCLRRCLQKDPAQRIHDVADVRLVLEGAFDVADSDADGGRGAGSADAWPPRDGWRSSSRWVPPSSRSMRGEVPRPTGRQERSWSRASWSSRRSAAAARRRRGRFRRPSIWRYVGRRSRSSLAPILKRS
jgi:serine/threonine protein kinase